MAIYVRQVLPRKLESDLAYVAGRSWRPDLAVILSSLALWLPGRRKVAISRHRTE